MYVRVCVGGRDYAKCSHRSLELPARLPSITNKEKDY